MPPFVKVRMTAKAQQGPCGHCEENILQAAIHVTVYQMFGQSKAGKTKYKGWHLHLMCLPKWLIGDYIRYMLRTKKAPGRPIGSILKLNPEDNQRRKWLVRTRARLIREVARSEDGKHIWDLYSRMLEIGQELKELGGDINANLVRRSPESKKAFMDKVKLKVRPHGEK